MPTINDPRPRWAMPETASVMDTLKTKMLRRIASIVGLDDLSGQVMGMASALEAPVSAPVGAISKRIMRLYHGSKRPIKGPLQPGHRWTLEGTPDAIWATPDPEAAAGYVGLDSGAIYPLDVAPKRISDVDWVERFGDDQYFTNRMRDVLADAAREGNDAVRIRGMADTYGMDVDRFGYRQHRPYEQVAILNPDIVSPGFGGKR